MDRPRLRIIHVITRLILGGAQENTLLTVEGLARDPRYQVSLITGPPIGPEGSMIDRARDNGVDLIIIPEMRREIHPYRDMATLLKLISCFRRERPDIVHTHSSKAGIIGRMAARCAGVPAVLHTIHGMAFHAHQSRAANALYIRLERMAARWSDKLISVADAMTEQAVAAKVAPPEQFVTIRSGMDTAPFLAETDARERIRREFGMAPDDIVIGKIARLFELKGHADVLNAAPAVLERFPQARLFFVGDGLLRGELEEQATRLGIRERVTFAGLVHPSRIPDMIKAMDLVVHASLREGLARVLPQALLSGCPVISYDVDGAREVVIDGETGYLVPPQSVEGLSRAMLGALSDLEGARAMAAEGRRRFAAAFGSDTMVRRIAELCEELGRGEG